MGLFSKKPSKPAPKTKTFDPPERYGFDYAYSMLVALASINRSGDSYSSYVSVWAEPGGKIQLTARADDARAVLRDDYGPVLQHYFGKYAHGDNGIKLEFMEPDCYLYGCPRDGFIRELEEYAPNGRFKTLSTYENGNISMWVEFRANEDWYECIQRVKKKLDIWYK